jgi:hypothetical protein
MLITGLSTVTDDELLTSMKTVLRTETNTVVQTLTHLVEIEDRRLHLEKACSSMWAFCTTKLGMSEGTASRRILASRLVRRFPQLLDALASDRIHLSNMLRLRDLFTETNVEELVDAVAGKSKRQVQELIARLPPPLAVTGPVRGDVRSSPLSEARFKLVLTVDARTLERLEHARALMRHQNPAGDIGIIFADALEALIEKREKAKLGKTSRPRATRAPEDPATVTQATRREVVERDGFQCTFVSAEGERCQAKDFLEFDHIVPRAQGGTGDPSNVRIRCRAHNRYAAEQVFGREHVEREIERKRREHPPTTTARATLLKALVGLGFRSAEAERALGRFGPEAWSRPVEALLRDALAALT